MATPAFEESDTAFVPVPVFIGILMTLARVIRAMPYLRRIRPVVVICEWRTPTMLATLKSSFQGVQVSQKFLVMSLAKRGSVHNTISRV